MDIRDLSNNVFSYKCKLYFILLFVPAILLTCNFTLAQSFYNVKKVDFPAPFKYSEITGIKTDKEGFTWFTNSQGIWRYDGTDIEPFEVHDKQFPKNTVPDIYIYDGYIMLFYNIARQYTLLAYDTHTSKGSKYSLDGVPVNFSENQNGTLSFYSYYGQQWSFSRHTGLSKGENIRLLAGWPPKTILDKYFADKDGSTYFFYGEKIAKLQNGRLYFGADSAIQIHGDQNFVKAYASRGLNAVTQVLNTPDRILAMSSNGFILYDKRSLKKLYKYMGIDVVFATVVNNRFQVFETGENKLDANDALFDLHQSPFTGLAGKVRAVTQGPNTKGILAATDKGIFELTLNPAIKGDNDKQQPEEDFFKGKSIRSILRAQNGKTYIGSYSGFYVWDGKTVRLLNSTAIYCMQQADEHTLILGTEGGTGFATLDTRTDQFALLPNKGYVTGYCLVKDGDGYIAGASYDIYRLKKQPNGQWLPEKMLHSDSLGLVKQITKINGQWWVASTTGLFKLGNGKTLVRIFPADEKYMIYAFKQDGSGIWLGTGGNGLIKIDYAGKVVRQINFSNGLAGEFVYSIFENNGLLYAGTNGGLSVFDTNSGMQSIITPDDGQYSEEFNHSASFYDENNRQLILGGVQGLLFPDMRYFASFKSKASDVLKLSYVKRGSNGVLPAETDLFAQLQKDIVLDPGVISMRLKLSGNNIWKRGRFLFRIRELDSLWSRGNLTDEIGFYALAPGSYTFQARYPSVSDQRFWLTKSIIVKPHFYQTWLFKLLVILMVALLIYAAWLYRLKQIRGQQLMRTAIASDLHDEIGSALTRISLSSELMNIKKPDKDLERISDDSKTAIASISDIIWSVDARNDNIEDLVSRMKAHAHNMLDEVADVNFETKGLDKVINLPQLVRQNLYLIFKEAVNNIVRHNDGPKVWISLNNELTGMTITIKNTINLKKDKAAFVGQGLKNIKMRAQRMKADAEIINTDGMFTIVLKMKRW